MPKKALGFTQADWGCLWLLSVYMDCDLLIGDGSSPRVCCLSKSVFVSPWEVVGLINQLWSSSCECSHSFSLLPDLSISRRHPQAGSRPSSLYCFKIPLPSAGSILMSACALALITPKFNLAWLRFYFNCNIFCKCPQDLKCIMGDTAFCPLPWSCLLSSSSPKLRVINYHTSQAWMSSCSSGALV